MKALGHGGIGLLLACVPLATTYAHTKNIERRNGNTVPAPVVAGYVTVLKLLRRFVVENLQCIAVLGRERRSMVYSP